MRIISALDIDGENIRLRGPSKVTYMLAGLIYDVRILATGILLRGASGISTAKIPRGGSTFRSSVRIISQLELRTR